MFVLFDVNLKKGFTIVWYFLSDNASIVWYDFWNCQYCLLVTLWKWQYCLLATLWNCQYWLILTLLLYNTSMITSKLEQLYQKQHNQIDVNHFKDQFFLGFLNLPTEECMDYEYGLSRFSYKLFTNIVTHFVAAIQSLYFYLLKLNYFNPIVFLLIPLFL